MNPIYSKYSHLSKDERIRIETLSILGCKATQIAKELNRNPLTIYRELHRHQPQINQVKYRADLSHKRAELKRKLSYKHSKIDHIKLRNFIEDGINRKWSPERIAGRWNLENVDIKISHQSIYNWIKNERNDLKKLLLHRRKYTRKLGSAASATKIPNRTDIDNRPQIINQRLTFGDIEADTMISSRVGKSCLAVFVDRKTRYLWAIKIPNKSSDEMNKATLAALLGKPITSITYDNGTENAKHEMVAKLLECATYFCKPYKSCEKGSIENRNKQIRQWVPKKTNLDLITQEYIDKIVKEINERPMKCLGWATPTEAIQKESHLLHFTL